MQPREDISDELMAHVRYPEDMFKVQREVFARYHVTDAQIFYTSQDRWQVPIDPTSPSAGDVAQPPYYLTLQVPGQTEPRFSLTTTFAPFNRETLAAFMAVNSDATDPEYGRIQALALPRNTTFPGPSQMQNNIESNQNVANALLSLRRGGSAEVEIGNLLTLPVAGGLMYVEPVYARATEGASYPTLRKVIVSFGDAVSIADTYEEALGLFFDGVAIDTDGDPNTDPVRAAAEVATAVAVVAVAAVEMPTSTRSNACKRRSRTRTPRTRPGSRRWPRVTSPPTARHRTTWSPPWSVPRQLPTSSG